MKWVGELGFYVKKGAVIFYVRDDLSVANNDFDSS